jgi:hypothetical protein
MFGVARVSTLMGMLTKPTACFSRDRRKNSARIGEFNSPILDSIFGSSRFGNAFGGLQLVLKLICPYGPAGGERTCVSTQHKLGPRRLTHTHYTHTRERDLIDPSSTMPGSKKKTMDDVSDDDEDWYDTQA